jgi:hypothetical protein
VLDNRKKKYDEINFEDRKKKADAKKAKKK